MDATVNGTLSVGSKSLTLNLTSLSSSQTQQTSLTVSEQMGYSVPVTVTYGGSGGAAVSVNPTNPTTAATIIVMASIGTMQAGGQTQGAVTFACDFCTNSPYGVPITINAPAATAPLTTSAAQIFPHFADGGEWQTDFLLENPNPSVVTVELRFHPDPPATALAIQGLGNETDLPNIVIQPNASVFYTTVGDPNANLTSGWVEVLSAQLLNGSALFRRHSSADGKYYEGSIPLAAPSTTFSLPFDGSQFAPTGDYIYTGLALANPNSGLSAAVTCAAYGLNGSLLGSNLQLASLPAFAHTSLILQFSSPVNSVIGTSKGELTCTSTAPVGVLGLRAFGQAAISALPVVTTH